MNFRSGLLTNVCLVSMWLFLIGSPASRSFAEEPAADGLEQLMNRLLEVKPEQVVGELEAVRAEIAKAAAEAKALRDQAAALDARTKDLARKAELMERLLALLTPVDDQAVAAKKAEEEKLKAEAAAKAAAEKAAAEKAAADAKMAEEMKVAAAKKAEEEKMKAEAAAKAAAEKAAADAKMAAEKAAAEKAAADAQMKEAGKTRINFADHISPIFMAKCASCHNQDKSKGGLAVDSFDGVMQGGGSGEIVTPGDASGSRLYRILMHEEEPNMPQGGQKLDDKTLELIAQWINDGALKDKNSKSLAKTSNASMEVVAPAVVIPEGELPMPIPQTDLVTTPLSGPLAIRTLAASPVAPLLAVNGYRQVLLYHAETLDPLRALEFPEGVAESIRFSPNGSLLVVAGGEAGKLGLAAVFDVITGERLGEFGRTFDTVLAADISLDHTQVVVGGTNRKARVYSTLDGSVQYEIDKHSDWVQDVAFSPDGWFLATADRSGVAMVWQAETGRDVHVLRGHEAAINRIAFRPDSNALATAGADGKVMIWEMADANRIRNWDAHKPGVLSVAWSRDGRLVTSGVDQSAALWQGDGKEIRRFGGLEDWTYAATFAAGDTRVAAGSWRGEVRVWEVADAKELGRITLAP